MSTTALTTEIPNLIGGRASVPAGTGWSDVFNPSRAEVIARVPLGGPAEVDAAVQAAQKAFVSWGATPVTKRAAVLFRYKQLLDQNFEALARLVTLENGKTLDESRGEERRGIEGV